MEPFLNKFLAWILPAKRFFSAGKTDTGRVRTNNEDAFYIMANKPLFLVADGMGGHNGGEIASRLAIDAMASYLTPRLLRRMRDNNTAIRHSLITAFHRANAAVIDMAASDETLSGMGCALLACLIDKNMLHTCHVGDARCYVATKNKFIQITRDHVFIQKEIRKANSRAKNKSVKAGQRSMLTRAIGFPFTEDPECHSRPLSAGDRILLCSDGLWNMVQDNKIKKVLRKAETPQIGVDSLVHMANEAGGHDNITAVAIYYDS